MRRSRGSKGRGAFSLIEAALAAVIVGTGIVAVVAGLGAGARVNDAGRDLTQAVFLAQEIREWTVRLPFTDPNGGAYIGCEEGDPTNPAVQIDDLDDLYKANGLTFDPPRDGLGRQITDMAGWSQRLSLSWRDANSLTAAVSPGASSVINVQLSVRFKGRDVLATNWLVCRRN